MYTASNKSCRRRDLWMRRCRRSLLLHPLPTHCCAAPAYPTEESSSRADVGAESVVERVYVDHSVVGRRQGAVGEHASEGKGTRRVILFGFNVQKYGNLSCAWERTGTLSSSSSLPNYTVSLSIFPLGERTTMSTCSDYLDSSPHWLFDFVLFLFSLVVDLGCEC